MYVSPNYKTKKLLKEAVAAGKQVSVYQPNDMFGTVIPQNGTVAVEGPHFPAAHTWYAQVVLTNGVVTKVK